MYGQLKSTVQCLDCNNISITFDPFLTISLPIARPFKLSVVYVPYEMFTSEGRVIPNLVYSIALNKESEVRGLEAKVLEILNKGEEEKE
jgi:ubiquitin carboxyl-terminal hydrolase 4/11